VAFVALRGQLVLGKETYAFRNIMYRLINNNYLYILVDMGELEKIDCAGLGEFVRCHALAHCVGSTVTLHNFTRRVRDLLVFTRLVTLFGCDEQDIPRAA
jgi:anti-anti-sigma factor